MIKKLLVVVAWLLALVLLALGCWVLGLYLDWPLWRSVALFIGVVVGVWLLWWLRGRWLAWRLRRRLARPVGTTTVSTARLDSDWRAGLAALKQSRLSRFGSPLYVLPWYLILGPKDAAKDELLRRVAGTAPVQGQGDDPAVLQWWLLRNGVVLDPTAEMPEEQQAPDAPNWRRLLHWMMRTRRREPLNGLILAFNAIWLADSTDAELNETGQGLRKRLDELTRIYDARVPVYVVLTGCQAIPGFSAWATALGPDITHHAMGFQNPAASASVTQFISDAFNSIVHRMFDLRVLQGVRAKPAADAFALPERMAPLAKQLSKVLRTAFQPTPYAETPLMRGLFMTGHAPASDRGQPAWFSPGLFNNALPAQRYAWRPVERWRIWRRLLRHAMVVAWLGACVAVGAFLIHAGNTARDQMHMAAVQGYGQQDFSGPMSADLHALQGERATIHALLSRPGWQQSWMPFQHRVNTVQRTLMNRFVGQFHREILAADLDPLLLQSLPQLTTGQNDTLLAAWAQTVVRRLNLLDAAIRGRDVYTLPAPGSELPVLLASAHQTLGDPMDGVLLGDMYRDYLTWQGNPQLLKDESRGLRQVLASLNLTDRSTRWIYAWVDMQGNLKPVRMSDFWDIADRPGLPFIPAALTPEGERAASGFLDELGRATGDTTEWADRRKEFQQHYQSAGLEAWFEFTDVFPHVPDLLPDGTARRAAMSTLLTKNDPYLRLMRQLAAVGDRLPANSRPDWIVQAGKLDALNSLAYNDPGTGTLQDVGVVQRFGGEVIKALPQGVSLNAGLNQLKSDSAALQLLQAYRKGIRDTITPLQQGDGTAMKAAVEIWSYGHDPNVKNVPLIDAKTALDTLHKQQGALGTRTNVVWDIAEGPMDFVLDYAARNAGCRLQQQWENTVLSAIQGVTDSELANQLLYGDRGQVKAFMDGDVKNFVDQDAVRFQARAADDKKVPLNGQFFAFASMTQLRQVALATQQLQSKRSADEAQGLTQQQADLEKQIAKLQATTGTVTLNTVPPQTNPTAHVLPQSVTLSLQCASGTINLENLNFPNSAVFPWSMQSCGDTTLRIHYANFDLTRQWSGTTGFVDFLKEFASGQRRYTPTDFPDQKTDMSQADVQWLVITYRQQGQGPLVGAFSQAATLGAQADGIKARLAELQPGTAPGSTMPPPAPLPSVPQKIVAFCMGPVNDISPDLAPQQPVIPVPAAPARTAVPTPTPRRTPPAPAPKTAGPSGPYAVQVGIFAHPESVLESLKKGGYTVEDTPITIKGDAYRQIRATGYTNRDSADGAAGKIAQMLQLKPEVIRLDQ
ncbi:MAG TPA: type VI secretion protein IcmF/TssM N-terminal domain-containing protein [Bordetella sp.]|nr:type VI secretion protein IcmF/TssM N-terminal domain-containing protein [Bordetella sp.]